MKQLTEMSLEELLKLREEMKEDLGEDVQDGDIGELSDRDLIEALTPLAELEEAAPSEKQGAPKSPPKGYPKSRDDYADPTNYKYPLSTEAFVRAALSYFSKSANRSKYSPEEQKFMWKRIIAAAKKYKIQLSPDVAKHAEKLGESISESEEVNEELNEKEIVELIHKALKEQMPTNNTGQAPNVMEAQGGVKVRVPPDIEAINTQLENFKQMHAKHEAANTVMSEKLATLQKQVSDMNEAFQKMSKQTEAVEPNPDDKNTEAKSAKSTKPSGGAKAAKTASENDDSDSDSDSDSEDSDSDDGDGQQEKAKEQAPTAKKVKEQAQQAHAEGVVATSDMTSGNGVSPPEFSGEEQDTGPRSFGDVMTRATRQRRRGIGAT